MARWQDIVQELDARRRKLKMPCRALARRSGVSTRTVQRALSGQAGDVGARTLLAMAEALGMGLGVVVRKSASRLRHEVARAKAKRIIAGAQGSFALEGQAVEESHLSEVRRDLEDKLVAGPPVRLWSD